MNPQHQQKRKICQSCRLKLYLRPSFIAFFNFSHKRPTFAFTSESGHYSAFGEGSHTRAYTAKQGAFRMGVVSLPSERSTRFGNPAWPGFKTANFAAFGAWSWVLPKNAESLRDSDALMRVAVPRRRGPAGLRDLFHFCRNCGLYILRSGLSACARRGVVSLPSARFTCC